VFKKANDVLFILGIAVLCESVAFVVTAATQKLDESISRRRGTLALLEDAINRFAPVPAADRNRKVYEQKFLNCVSVEFDRVGRGELAVKKLAQSEIRPRARPVGGK